MADEGQKFEGYSQVDSIALDDVFLLVDKSDTTHSLQGTTKYCTAQQIANLVTVSQNPAVENSYLTIAAMLADQGNQTEGQIQYADNAAADPTVVSGYAFYTYNGTTAGTLSDYTKLSAEETLAITRGVRTWTVSDIQSDAIHLSSVETTEVGLEYNAGTDYLTGLLLSLKFTRALEYIIADASSVDYYVKIYNQNYDKYFQAPVTSFTTVNTDYVRVNIGGTIPREDEIEIGHLLEISFDVDVQDGAGDMLAATYDPTSVEGDAFDMDNMVEGADTKILTAAERAAIASHTSEIAALVSSYSRRKAVIDIVDNTAAPPTEVSGDRYILDNTGSSHANWDGASAFDIVEFDGTNWVATTPLEGYIAYVDAEDKDALYIDDGSPEWQLRDISAFDLAAAINGATNKATPVDADKIGIWDSVSGLLRNITWANIKTTLKTYFDTLYFFQSNVIDEDNMASDSATKVPTQQSVKAYVDANSGGSSIPDVYNVKDYDVEGDGIDFADASITSGSPNLQVDDVTFTADDVGKVVVLVGAGSGGDFFKSTIITFTDANNVVLDDNASTTISGESGFFGTDDTAAIQTLINTAYSNGGGRILFPKGIYIIDGDLQNDVGDELIDYNSQLYIPYQYAEDKTRNTVELMSNSITNFQQGTGFSGVGDRRAANSGALLRSTIIGSGSLPSIIASKGVVGDPSNSLGYNFATTIITGLNFQFVPFGNKITIGGLNFKFANTIKFEYNTLYPYYLHLDTTLQPDTSVIGISMPGVNSGNINVLTSNYLAGFYTGILAGDHAIMTGNFIAACINAIVFPAITQSLHLYGCILHWCQNFLVWEGICYVNVHDLNIEVATQSLWYDTLYVVKDSNNYGRGKITYHIVSGGVGVDYTELTVIGGSNLMIMPLGMLEADFSVSGTTDSELLTSLLTALNNIGLIKYESALSPLVYYRFNNNLTDEVAGLNGSGTSITYATGKGGANLALDCAGGSSYVTVADDDILSFPGEAWSVAFMVYFDTVAGNQVIFNKRNSSFNEYQVNLTGGNLRLALFTGAAFILCDTSGFTFSTSTWYHIVVTDNGGTGSNKNIYVNSVLQTMTYGGASYTGMANTSSPLYIGTQGTSLGTNSFDGRIQRLGLYSGELTQAQIDTLFATEYTDNNDLV